LRKGLPSSLEEKLVAVPCNRGWIEKALYLNLLGRYSAKRLFSVLVTCGQALDRL